MYHIDNTSLAEHQHTHLYTSRRCCGYHVRVLMRILLSSVRAVRGSHLGETVLGKHVKQRSLPALAVPHHHDLTLHTLTGIHSGFQR